MCLIDRLGTGNGSRWEFETCARAIGGLLLSVALVACGDGPDQRAPAETPGFVATIPPLAMIVQHVVKGRASVRSLLKPGGSPHTYAPVPSDVRAATEARALFYGSEHLDGWAAELPARSRVALVNLLPDSSQLSFDEGSARDSGIDPHFWTDPIAVASLLPPLVDTLCAVDAAGCSTYRSNAASLDTTLHALDRELTEALRPIRDMPVVLSQPFFRYFLARYGPRLVGVLEPSSGNEPSPRQMQTMVTTIGTAGVRAVLTQRQGSERSAQVVAEAANVGLVTLDPLGGGPGRETYADLLRSNARTLVDALETEP